MLVTVDLGDWQPTPEQIDLLQQASRLEELDVEEGRRWQAHATLRSLGMLSIYDILTPLGAAVLRAVSAES